MKSSLLAYSVQFTPAGRKAKHEAKVYSDDTADAIDKALDDMVAGFGSGDRASVRLSVLHSSWS